MKDSGETAPPVDRTVGGAADERSVCRAEKSSSGFPDLTSDLTSDLVSLRSDHSKYEPLAFSVQPQTERVRDMKVKRLDHLRGPSPDVTPGPTDAWSVKEEEHALINNSGCSVLDIYKRHLKSYLVQKNKELRNHIPLCLREGHLHHLQKSPDVPSSPVLCSSPVLLSPVVSLSQLWTGGQERTVVTEGTAGSGKTGLVQRLMLDWCEDFSLDRSEERTVDFSLVLPLSVSLLKTQQGVMTLMELMKALCPPLRHSGIKDISVYERVLIIVDGLDECLSLLDFSAPYRHTTDTALSGLDCSAPYRHSAGTALSGLDCSAPYRHSAGTALSGLDFSAPYRHTTSTALSGLDCSAPYRHGTGTALSGLDCRAPYRHSAGTALSALLSGQLLPLARLWVTCLPGALGQIPPTLVHRVTHVSGFERPQREAYFSQTVPDLAVSHILSSDKWDALSRLPVVCRIIAALHQTRHLTHHTGEQRLTQYTGQTQHREGERLTQHREGERLTQHREGERLTQHREGERLTQVLALLVLWDMQRMQQRLGLDSLRAEAVMEAVMELASEQTVGGTDATAALLHSVGGTDATAALLQSVGGTDATAALLQSGLCFRLYTEDLSPQERLCFIHECVLEFMSYLHLSTRGRQRNLKVHLFHLLRASGSEVMW